MDCIVAVPGQWSLTAHVQSDQSQTWAFRHQGRVTKASTGLEEVVSFGLCWSKCSGVPKTNPDDQRKMTTCQNSDFWDIIRKVETWPLQPKEKRSVSSVSVRLYV
jgi:hypothetical protein